MAGLEAHTDKQINKMKKQVIKCINKQDKEGLKKLFSKDAQKHIEDLDGKLDQLIGAFNGNKIESAKGLGPTLRVQFRHNPCISMANITLCLAVKKSIEYILAYAIKMMKSRIKKVFFK